MSISPKHPDVEVKLCGEDGNAFAIIGRVSRHCVGVVHLKKNVMHL